MRTPLAIFMSLALAAPLVAHPHPAAESHPSGPRPWLTAPRPAAPAGRLVLTTFEPFYAFAANVAQGSRGLTVFNLGLPEEGPHEFEIGEPSLAARHRELVARAEAVVTLPSVGLSPEIERVYPWCRRQNIHIVQIDPVAVWDATAPHLPLIPTPVDSEHGEPLVARPPNPHVWLSLANAERLVGSIASDLARLDVPNAALYQANAMHYRGEIARLHADAERRFASAGRLRVAALTEGFPYLTSELGIEVADYLLEPKDPAEITRRVKAAGVTVVLAEDPPEAPVKAAVERAGAHVLVLTTIEHPPGDKLTPDGYLDAMKANIDALAVALLKQ